MLRILKLLRKHKKTNLLLVLLVLGLMYYFSGQDSVASDGVSSWFVHLFRHKLSNHFIRKCAHFTEFTLLGFLFTALLGDGLEMLYTLPVGLLAATADEFHQTFSMGRAPMMQDVLLDFSGVLFGFAIVLLCTVIVKKRDGSSV